MFYDRPLTAQTRLSLIGFLKLKRLPYFERQFELAMSALGSYHPYKWFYRLAANLVQTSHTNLNGLRKNSFEILSTLYLDNENVKLRNYYSNLCRLQRFRLILCVWRSGHSLLEFCRPGMSRVRAIVLRWLHI